jgi:hypothetical protein
MTTAFIHLQKRLFISAKKSENVEQVAKNCRSSDLTLIKCDEFVLKKDPCTFQS